MVRQSALLTVCTSSTARAGSRNGNEFVAIWNQARCTSDIVAPPQDRRASRTFWSTKYCCGVTLVSVSARPVNVSKAAAAVPIDRVRG